MPEILPDQRFDDCWRRNTNAGDTNSSYIAAQNYRSEFNKQDKSSITGIPNNNLRNRPNEGRFIYNKRNNSPSRFHEKSVESFSSRHRVHTNESHRIEDKYERKYKRYSRSRSKSPSRYRRSIQYSRHGEKSEHRRPRSRSPCNKKHTDQDKYMHSREKYKSHKRRKNNRDYEHLR